MDAVAHTDRRKRPPHRDVAQLDFPDAGHVEQATKLAAELDILVPTNKLVQSGDVDGRHAGRGKDHLGDVRVHDPGEDVAGRDGVARAGVERR